MNISNNVKKFLEYVGDKYRTEIFSYSDIERDNITQYFIEEEAKKFLKISKSKQIEKYGFYVSTQDLMNIIPSEGFINDEGELPPEVGMKFMQNQFSNMHLERIEDDIVDEDNDDIEGFVKYSDIKIEDKFLMKNDKSIWTVKDKIRSSGGKKAILFENGWDGGPIIYEYAGLHHQFEYQPGKKINKNNKLPQFQNINLGQIILSNERKIGYVFKISNLNGNKLHIKFGNQEEEFLYPNEFPKKWTFSEDSERITFDLEDGDYSYDKFFSKLILNKESSKDIVKSSFFENKIEKLKDSKRIILSRSLINFTRDLKNDIRYRTLPFDRFFIDSTFELSKGIWIQGILIENLDSESRNQILDDQSIEDKLIKKDMQNKNIRITALLFDEKYNNSFILEDMLSRFLGNSQSINKLFNIIMDEDENLIFKDYSSDIELIYMIIFNVMDLYHNREVEKIKYVLNPKHIKKRQHSGKLPLPYVTVKLGPVKELKIYLNKYNQKRVKLGIQQIVRPFWRHFYNKKKFHILYENLEIGELDDKYQVDEDGIIKTLIAEHIRGDGPLIEKDLKFTY